MAEPVARTPSPTPVAPIQAIANPVPVGVAGFALTTFTLGLYTSGNFNAKGEVLVLGLAAFYGGLTQFIAGWFALSRGDIFPAAFMTTYGAFWASYVALVVYVVPRAGDGASQAATIFLVMWTVITFIFTISSAWTNWVVLFTFTEFLATIIVLDIGSWAANTSITHAGGYMEMILGVLAWFVVCGEIVNDVSGRAIFPFPPTPWQHIATVRGEPLPS